MDINYSKLEAQRAELKKNVDHIFGRGSYEKVISPDHNGHYRYIKINGHIYEISEPPEILSKEKPILLNGPKYVALVKELKNGKRIAYLLPKKGFKFLELATEGTYLEIAIIDGKHLKEKKVDKKSTLFLANIQNMESVTQEATSNWAEVAQKAFKLVKEKLGELKGEFGKDYKIRISLFDFSENAWRRFVLRCLVACTAPIVNVVKVYFNAESAFKEAKDFIK